MVKLVALGLLMEEPLHGYAIRRRLDERYGDACPVRYGSIYHALRRLTEQGLAEVAGTVREGSGPERRVYRITRAGRETFLKDLRGAMRKDVPKPDPFGVVCGFAHHLEPGELREALGERLEKYRQITSLIREKRQHFQSSDLELRRFIVAMLNRSMLHVGIEIQWIEEILDQMVDPEFLTTGKKEP